MAGIRKVIIEMDDFREKDYKVFEMFDKNWAVVTAGTMTISTDAQLAGVAWEIYGAVWERAVLSLPCTCILHAIPVNF